jgi:ectoine hydroxylase-related dioxygenase (phytanoyl-CoA dioxygenase family)
MMQAEDLKIDALESYRLSILQPEAACRLPWDIKNTLLCGLGLNMLETLRFLNERQPSLHDFEAWIVHRNGNLDEAALDRLRRALAGETVGSEIGSLEGVEALKEADLTHWDEHGYVVLKNAVSAEMAEAAELAIYADMAMDRDDPASWYSNPQGHTIWVRLLRHPAMLANRRSPRIVKAFAQLWGREDLWTTVDQAGLNPPERDGWRFPGPHLHWDTTLAPPHHFGVQGILYLADVAEDQGAFSCVPGFHKTLQAWLDAQPEGSDVRVIAANTLTMKPIAAQRGDMVLWHQSLPHGSSPNRAARPRVAQYISMSPTQWPYTEEWI